jgi:anti-sigma factor NepR-like protein
MSFDSKSSRAGRRGLAGLSERLREMFGAMTAQPLPDELMDLVDQLEAQSGPDEAGPRAERAVLSPA